MTGLAKELIGKRCIFNLNCPIDYSFHWAVVSHIQKVQEQERVGDLAPYPFNDVFLTNAIRLRGPRAHEDFVPEFQGGLDMSMLTVPMPDPCNDSVALKSVRGGEEHQHLRL